MAKAQRFHLPLPTRHEELIGETTAPWCWIYMQELMSNQSGHLTEMLI